MPWLRIQLIASCTWASSAAAAVHRGGVVCTHEDDFDVDGWKIFRRRKKGGSLTASGGRYPYSLGGSYTKWKAAPAGILRARKENRCGGGCCLLQSGRKACCEIPVDALRRQRRRRCRQKDSQKRNLLARAPRRIFQGRCLDLPFCSSMYLFCPMQRQSGPFLPAAAASACSIIRDISTSADAHESGMRGRVGWMMRSCVVNAMHARISG